MEDKKCTKCGGIKKLEAFSKDNRAKDGRQSRCKLCQSEVKRQMASYYRSKHLEYKYGITQDDYNRMLEEQESCCSICGIHEKHCEHQRLAVDHDHNTGEVRGLICKKCNQAIGLLQDNSEFAYNAYQYLQRHGK
jgi:hypothetical protein